MSLSSFPHPPPLPAFTEIPRNITCAQFRTVCRPSPARTRHSHSYSAGAPLPHNQIRTLPRVRRHDGRPLTLDETSDVAQHCELADAPAHTCVARRCSSGSTPALGRAPSHFLELIFTGHPHRRCITAHPPSVLSRAVYAPPLSVHSRDEQH